jgi:hypothetical protein
MRQFGKSWARLGCSNFVHAVYLGAPSEAAIGFAPGGEVEIRGDLQLPAGLPNWTPIQPVICKEKPALRVKRGHAARVSRRKAIRFRGKVNAC